MTLTLGQAPLAGRPRTTVNYHIEGPAHRLLFEPFPRRVRAALAGAVVLDTEQGMLLHETGILPQLYLPWEDITAEVRQTDHHTSCPFKGEASYWSVAVDGHSAENAIWSYPEPNEDTTWLRGYAAVYWTSMDTWYDEDEEVFGHLRDPYHRIDVRRTSRPVTVTVDGVAVAESRRAQVLSETGLPNRYYLPREDVRGELLRRSDTSTVCPYKGRASYLDIRLPGRTIPDAAWFLADPLDGATAVRDHLCFLGKGVVTSLDDEVG